MYSTSKKVFLYVVTPRAQLGKTALLFLATRGKI